MTALPSSIDDTSDLLRAQGYVPERALATSVFLALKLGRPLFLEGEAGVGKTEIAKVLSAALGRDLIRLQCYEGLDTANAVYEWNYPRQMMAIRLAEASGKTDQTALSRTNLGTLTRDIYSAEYLIARPLLKALEPHANGAPVLLIDEIDRADEPFEAFLLEVLSDYQITIPEWGTIKAEAPPIVIITSNRTREVHDALKRRCLYHWVDYPSAERERAILSAKQPDVAQRLSGQVVAFVQSLRGLELFKPPGIAETLDWARALGALDATALDQANVDATLGVLLKYQDDIAKVRGETAARLLAQPPDQSLAAQ